MHCLPKIWMFGISGRIFFQNKRSNFLLIFHNINYRKSCTNYDYKLKLLEDNDNETENEKPEDADPGVQGIPEMEVDDKDNNKELVIFNPAVGGWSRGEGDSKILGDLL